jgi:ceramide glucosyltransferase
MYFLVILLWSGALFGLAYTAVSWWLLVSASRKKRAELYPQFRPPVSIFKPLKGLDESLRGNLETFFRQDYPRYELIFGVSEFDDPAIDVVRSLQAAYPHVPTTLVIDSSLTGYNPKVNSLCNMAPHATHDFWVISDSNVRVDTSYLARLVEPMRDPQVGLVTSIIRGVGGKSLGARLENLHLNSFVAASTIAVNRLSNIPVSIGKSMLMRRETISELGGFEAFANYLLEDGLIGRQVRGLGLRTETSMDAVENVNASWTVGDFLKRHYRWGLMRRQLNLVHYTGEILSNPVFLALLAAIVLPSVSSLTLLGIVCAVKASLDLVTVRAVGGSLDVSSALLLPFKDLLIGVIWWKPFFTNRVSWRGHQFRIGAMTRIYPVGQRANFRSGRMSGLVKGLENRYRQTKARLAALGAEA